MAILPDNSEFLGASKGGKETAMTISANSVMFNILRNKIYNNPLLSCLRELVDNAIDSHRAANKADVPIKIYVGQNSFTVQDEGVGLTPEQIEEVYSVYGNSSKRSDQTQQGCFGLGSKTPWAVSTIFTVTSITKKVKRQYQCYLDSTNAGKIRLISEEDSNEPTGVSIQVPVKISEKELEAVISYRHLHKIATPKLIGREILLKKAIIDEDLFCILEGPSNWQSSSGLLVNGLFYAWKESFRWTLPKNILLKFGIGELELAANREGVQEDNEKNSQLIKERATSAQLFIEAKSAQYFANCANLEEVITLWQSVFTSIPKITYDGVELDSQATYQGYYISKSSSYRSSGSRQICRESSHFTHQMGTICLKDREKINRNGIRKYMIDRGISRLSLIDVADPISKFCTVKLSDFTSPPRKAGIRKKKNCVYVHAKIEGEGRKIRIENDVATTYIYSGYKWFDGRRSKGWYLVDDVNLEVVKTLPNWELWDVAESKRKEAEFAKFGVSKEIVGAIRDISHSDSIKKILLKKLSGKNDTVVFNHYTPNGVDENKRKLNHQEIIKKYPLLPKLDNHIDEKLVKDYVDMCDRCP